MMVRWSGVQGNGQVNVKSQSELDIGGCETCNLTDAHYEIRYNNDYIAVSKTFKLLQYLKRMVDVHWFT